MVVGAWVCKPDTEALEAAVCMSCLCLILVISTFLIYSYNLLSYKKKITQTSKGVESLSDSYEAYLPGRGLPRTPESVMREEEKVGMRTSASQIVEGE